jgi:hypothetical protein
MHIQEAVAVFQKYGVDIVDMPAAQIRKSRNVLMQNHHPDAGGTVDAAQEINEAFSLVKNIPFLKATPEPRQPTEPQPQPNKWAWAGHSGPGTPNSTVLRNSFTDFNFIKKSMWELSEKSNDEWMIYGYDGILFTNTVVVYGSSKIFHYMAVAMIDCQTKGSAPLSCRAVFARPTASNELHLIYADEKYYDQNPIKFELDSKSINNSKFMQELAIVLDQLLLCRDELF